MSPRNCEQVSEAELNLSPESGLAKNTHKRNKTRKEKLKWEKKKWEIEKHSNEQKIIWKANRTREEKEDIKN